MAAPASQVIAAWIFELEVSEEWVLLREVCFTAVKQRGHTRSEDEIWDVVEDRLQYVAENIRNDLATRAADGIPIDLEIDNEASPYIRSLRAYNKTLLEKLRRIQPRAFEVVCSKILEQFRAKSEVTQQTRDGGVDFFAVDFDFIPDGLPTPQACRAAVIGQAKRYAENNTVNENQLRNFIGGAIRRRHDLACAAKIYPMSPTSYAFWTTSDFGPDAREYARAMGLWFMEGRGLAKYVEALGLQDYVMALPDAPVAGGGQGTKAA